MLVACLAGITGKLVQLLNSTRPPLRYAQLVLTTSLLLGQPAASGKTRFTPEIRSMIVLNHCFGVSEIFFEDPVKSYSEMRIEIDRGQGWENWFRGYREDHQIMLRFHLPSVKIRAYACLGDNCQENDSMPVEHLKYQNHIDGCGQY